MIRQCCGEGAAWRSKVALNVGLLPALKVDAESLEEPSVVGEVLVAIELVSDSGP